MDEYIERKALREAFENADADVVEEYEDGTCDWGFGHKNIMEVINSVPAADVATVRHGRWIPVTERLPKLIPSCAGTAYSEAVNVLTTGRKVLTAIYDGNDFIADAEFWDAEGEEITHWTPVLLPLPEPPKGE